MNIRTYHLNIIAWLLFIMLFLMAFSETTISLYIRWMRFDESYAHGFLVMLIAIYLIYVNKNVLRNIQCEPNYYAGIPLVVFSLLWFLAYQTDIEMIQQLLLPVILMSVILMTQGNRMLKILWFAIGFLYFAIPIWDYLNNILITLTVAVVTYLVRLSGITAFIEADTITLSSGKIIIAQGCSGLRYLIICTSLASLSAYLTESRVAFRTMLVMLGIFIGLLTNWLRVYFLVVVGYMTGMQSELLHDHELFGWVLFILFFSPVYILTYRKQQRQHSSAPMYVATIPLKHESRGKLLTRWVLVCLAAFSGPIIARISTPEPGLLQPANIQLSGISNIKLLPSDPNEFIYYFANMTYQPVSSAVFVYESGQFNIQIASAIYDKNSEDRNYLPYYRSIIDPNIWKIETQDRKNVPGRNHELQIRELEVISKSSEERALVWYWFDISGRTSNNTYIAKLLEIMTIFSGSNYAAVTIIQTQCQETCNQYRDIFRMLAINADSAVTNAITY